MQTSTLRPGLLVSLATSIRGNVRYQTRDIEAEHVTADGAKKATWETERTVTDPAEHDAAIKVRGKARSLITAVCAQSAFGLLCPENRVADLDEAVAGARRLADEFNSTARLTRIGVYVIAGRIAPDDLEAVRAINSEVRDLLADMERGLTKFDVTAIRDAANKARNLGSMLTPDAAARIQTAIDAARSAARRIVKAGEGAALTIDHLAIRRLTSARTAFLDLDEQAEIQTPTASGRALDMMPDDAPVSQAAAPASPPMLFEL